MKFFIRTARHMLFDRKRNEEILGELTVQPADEKLRRYQRTPLIISTTGTFLINTNIK
jgi:hypothetical protein